MARLRDLETKTVYEGLIMRATEFIIEGKKNRRDKRHTIKPKSPVSHAEPDKANESKDIRQLKVSAEKPRNFVAKNAKMGGAGQHKDKKKAAKQGDVKHKGKVDEMDKSQTPPGRDGGSSVGKEYYGKPLKAKQMMDRAHKAMMKSMSNDEKKDKGWRNPNKKDD